MINQVLYTAAWTGFKRGDYMDAKRPSIKINKSKTAAYKYKSLFINVDVYVENKYMNSYLLIVNVKEALVYFSICLILNWQTETSYMVCNLQCKPAKENYGIKFIHNNVSGKNDKMNVWLYNRLYEGSCIQIWTPFADKSLKWGYNVYLNYGRRENWIMEIETSKQQFFKAGFFVREKY